MKWSSWSLRNEPHLPAWVCVHISPPPSSPTQDDRPSTLMTPSHSGGDGAVTSVVSAACIGGTLVSDPFGTAAPQRGVFTNVKWCFYKCDKK